MTATHGLVLGKFYPPHAGHHYLIRTAAAQCDELTVLAAGATVETIPVELRHRWLAEEHPDVRVVSCRDDVPVDLNDPEIWDAHQSIWERAIGCPVDVVFCSEPYGAELARRLEARCVTVDAERAAFPVSGTQVRADPSAHWDLLAPSVRAHLTHRVVVCGAESTGTTTLARALADRYETVWVPEYGRQYAERKASEGTVDDWSPEDFIVIAARQQHLEDTAARSAGPVMFCDTNVVATQLFEELYLGAASDEVTAMAAARTPAMYLLTDHEGVPFEDDGTRVFETQRAAMTGRFEDVLSRQPAPWLKVTGPPQERLEQAIDAVDQVLEDGWYFADPLG